MKASKISLRRTAVAFAAAAGLAAWSATGSAQTGGAPSMPGPGMMNGPAAGYGPGAMRGYGAPPPAEERGYGYGPGYGMGPWMMGGYGQGYGMGRGTMGGYGMGPGWMHGCRGYGTGPGWRHGYGGYGMGPSMMRGYGGYGMMGGYGMGPGWMHGYGGYGMAAGPGWMHGYRVLDLSDEQAAKVQAIYASAHKQGWDLGTKLFDARRKLIEVLSAEKPDRHAVVEAYKALSGLRLQRLELSLATRAKVDALLTPKQREELRSWRWGGFGPR